MFARKNGELVSRDCTCKCGKEFTQYMVSKRYVEILQTFPRAYSIFVGKAPKGYLPLNCIPCERQQLYPNSHYEDYTEIFGWDAD